MRYSEKTKKKKEKKKNVETAGLKEEDNFMGGAERGKSVLKIYFKNKRKKKNQKRKLRIKKLMLKKKDNVRQA